MFTIDKTQVFVGLFTYSEENYFVKLIKNEDSYGDEWSNLVNIEDLKAAYDFEEAKRKL